MNIFLQRQSPIALCLCMSAIAMGQDGGSKTEYVPPSLRVPDGHVLYLKTHATGTQNYVCAPGPAGPLWRFLGPQATVFVNLPGGEVRQQIATHFLSANPAEAGAPRPAWQHSDDTSTVWARAIESHVNAPVAPGAIPWLLLQVVGSQAGPAGGSWLQRITYIQRLNTSGGVAPSSGCDTSNYGATALVPYSTDYLFYVAEKQP